MQHILFGKDIRIIYENISGKSILFGRTDILPAVQEMFQKKCSENIWKTRDRKVMTVNAQSI